MCNVMINWRFGVDEDSWVGKPSLCADRDGRRSLLNGVTKNRKFNCFSGKSGIRGGISVVHLRCLVDIAFDRRPLIINEIPFLLLHTISLAIVIRRIDLYTDTSYAKRKILGDYLSPHRVDRLITCRPPRDGVWGSLRSATFPACVAGPW